MLSQMQQTEHATIDFQTGATEIVAEAGDELKIRIGDFAGPLDLLLYLIRQEQASIFDIPIAKITDEYLRYIRLMESLDIAIAADFLVIAAQLIEIKSKMLLPSDPFAGPDEEIEDPRRELVDRLLEYEKYKSAAQVLYERSTIEQAVFTRGRPDVDEENTEVNATVFDLISVFQRILARQKEEIALEIVRDEVSLADMIKGLKQRLSSGDEFSVMAFFAELHTRRELVTAFIAVLEVVRSMPIRLIQRSTFGDIILKRA